jgi:hypothetical protein
VREIEILCVAGCAIERALYKSLIFRVNASMTPRSTKIRVDIRSIETGRKAPKERGVIVLSVPGDKNACLANARAIVTFSTA